MVEHLPVEEGRSAIDKEGVEQHVLLHTYNLMLVHYEIQPGYESSYHNHPHEQLGYVIGGKAIQIVGDEEHTLGAGTCYRLESGEKHAMRAVGDEPFEVLDVFHPVREDYLPA